jgi:hypothetical protein
MESNKKWEEWKREYEISNKKAMEHIANVRSTCDRLGLRPSELLNSREYNYIEELKK